MKNPTVFPKYIINNNIEGNKYGVAILNNTTLGIHHTQAMQKKNTGRHYDRQRPHEMPNQGCGCWGTSGIRITNLDILNTVVVVYRTSRFMMRKFSSNKLNLDIFQDKSFPQTVPVIALEHTDARNNFKDAMVNCVDLINNHGGFTLVM